MSSTKGVDWLLPRASDKTRQCDETEAATPTTSSASAVAALLAVLCVLLVLRVLQLQRRLSRRHAATAKTTDFADPSDHPFWPSFHHYRTSSNRASSPKPVLTISVPQTPATPAIPEVVSEPATIVVGGGAASDPWPLDDIEAYLIDLDGTIYSPSGPIDGAAEFYAAVLRHKPHVFLSNTGAKGADGVRQKLLRNGIIMGPKSQDRCIYTAAQAQCKYMADTIPPGARVFVIAGGNADGPGSYWMKLLNAKNEELVSSWHIVTRLTDAMAREWAAAAAAARPVYVVLFSDGSISAVTDPRTGETGFADWSYDVIKKTSFVLSHGAHLIATAEDAFNPSTDNMPLPGPGMFCAMFRKLLHPLGGDRLHICGKGGDEGDKYMLSHALDMLAAQGWKGDRSRVLIVGDRFDTDIKGGSLAGVRTCLVESGCHAAELQPYFPDAIADYAAASVAELIPPSRRFADSGKWRRGTVAAFDLCTPTIKPGSGVQWKEGGGSGGGGGVGPAIRANAAPAGWGLPGLSKQISADRSLRAWQLGHGNLVYSAAAAGSACAAADVQGPLILVLRRFFEQRAREHAGHAAAATASSSSRASASVLATAAATGTAAAATGTAAAASTTGNGAAEGQNNGDDGGDSLPTISAADALEAMGALGIKPPPTPDGRLIHRFPFDLGSSACAARVTFAQLCRAVQRSLEAPSYENTYNQQLQQHQQLQPQPMSAQIRPGGGRSSPPSPQKQSVAPIHRPSPRSQSARAGLTIIGTDGSDGSGSGDAAAPMPPEDRKAGPSPRQQPPLVARGSTISGLPMQRSNGSGRIDALWDSYNSGAAGGVAGGGGGNGSGNASLGTSPLTPRALSLSLSPAGQAACGATGGGPAGGVVAGGPGVPAAPPATEAPAMLQTSLRRTRRAMPGAYALALAAEGQHDKGSHAAALPPSASDTTLESLEKRWHDEAAAREMARSGRMPHAASFKEMRPSSDSPPTV